MTVQLDENALRLAFNMKAGPYPAIQARRLITAIGGEIGIVYRRAGFSSRLAQIRHERPLNQEQRAGWRPADTNRDTFVVGFRTKRVVAGIVEAVRLSRLRRMLPGRKREIGITALLRQNRQLVIHTTVVTPSFAARVVQRPVAMNESEGGTALRPQGERALRVIGRYSFPDFPAQRRFRIVPMMQMQFDL